MALAALLLLLGAGIVLTSPALGKERARRLAGFALPAIGVAAMGWGLRRVLLPRGFGFFIGDWKERVLADFRIPLRSSAPWRASFCRPTGWASGSASRVWTGFAATPLDRRARPFRRRDPDHGLCMRLLLHVPRSCGASSFFRIVAGTVPLAILGAALLRSGCSRGARKRRMNAPLRARGRDARGSRAFPLPGNPPAQNRRDRQAGGQHERQLQGNDRYRVVRGAGF